MEDRICLDTDFLVNFLRNKEQEREFIAKNESRTSFATTQINIFELYYGAFKSGDSQNLRQVEELQNRLRILNLSDQAAKSAGQILAESQKRGETIDFRDLLIGCIAETEGYCIKTNNLKRCTKRWLSIPRSSGATWHDKRSRRK